MIGLLLVAAAAAAALLLAASARLGGLVSTLLAAYLAYVANIDLVTLALSPLHEVTRAGLAVAEVVVLAAALAVWLARSRPAVPLAGARATARTVLVEPVTALFCAAVATLLGYELFLGLAAPVIRWDSLTYHLARVAAWVQHSGIYWITNAPDVRMNALQPLAEQQILFLFVASGHAALSTLPQYTAELASLVAVYGVSRRLGFAARPALCAALMLATFSLVAFQSTTSDNDLVAASFPVVATYFLLGCGELEPVLGGVGAALGLGAKLTTALLLPVLVWLAITRGRRVVVRAFAGGVAGFVVLAMWGYLLNAVHHGPLLGVDTTAQGTGTQSSVSGLGYPRSVANLFYFAYATMDLSDLSNRLIELLALLGAAAAVAAAAWALRRGRPRRALGDAAGVLLPFLAPLLVLVGAAAIADAAGLCGFPIRGPVGIVTALDRELDEVYGRIDNEDYAVYGPIGIVALLAATVVTLRAWQAQRADARHLALAAAFPLFLVLVAIQTAWNPTLTHYFVVPAVLAAPLLAVLFRGRATTAAYLVVATLTVALTVADDQARPLRSPDGAPWTVTQPQAFDLDFEPDLGNLVTAYARLVPSHACVGAVLDPDEPSYLLFGPNLEHHVDFLPVDTALQTAIHDGLVYVVITTGTDAWVTPIFEQGGWSIRSLAGYWQLATAPHPGPGACLA